MKHSLLKNRYESALIPVLWIALYPHAGPQGFLGSGLAGTLACLIGGLAFFLRIWLPLIWAQGFCVTAVAAIAQAAWIKLGLWPWWALAALGLVLPALENLRSEGALKNFSIQCALFLISACVFLELRSLLQQSEFAFLSEHAAGVFLLLSLMALFLQNLLPGKEKA